MKNYVVVKPTLDEMGKTILHRESLRIIAVCDDDLVATLMALARQESSS